MVMTLNVAMLMNLDAVSTYAQGLKFSDFSSAICMPNKNI